MKHLLFSFPLRAAGLLPRARTLLLLLVAVIAQAAWAENEGPWTYNSYRYGSCSFSTNNSIAFKSLGNNLWGDCSIYKYHDDDGIGFTVKGNSTANAKNAVFSIYTHTENVPEYTRKVLKWNFELRSKSNIHVQTTALYARDNLENLKNMNVDFTQDYTNQTNSQYRIALQNSVFKESVTNTFNHDFEFDNRSSGTAQDKTWALLLTHVVGNGGSSEYMNQWGGFKNTSYTWVNYYYKYITFNNNGGTGSMSGQAIEDSGTLNACTMTREGYFFTGWNTKSDGTGTSYADQATITATSSSKGNVDLYAQWVKIADALQGHFHQLERMVTLSWTARKGLPNGKFEIWRNGSLISTLSHTSLSSGSKNYSFDDTNTKIETKFPYESNVRYAVWFVETDKGRNDDYKTAITVSTTRKVPVNNLTVVSQDNRIVFTWTSDGYPTDWGNAFNIYVDNETTPICTVQVEADNQTTFQWEHRRDPSHSDRQNSKEGSGSSTIYYTSESGLDACSPHNYRIEGVIGDEMLNKATVNNKAIGGGTLFDSFKATKGVYPGIVKLSWKVSLGSQTAKTYIVDRKRAEKDESWTELYRTSSADEYLTYTDDTPLPGIYYDYRVTVQDKCSNGTIVSNEITDIGFAQSTGTVSGRVTYGATGSSVANVDVEVMKTGDNDDDYDQYHAMRFTSTNGAVTWDYPNGSYAKEKFQNASFSIQLWINPTELPAQNDLFHVIKFGPYFSIVLNSQGQLGFRDRHGTNTTYRTIYFESTPLTPGQYNHVTLTRNGMSLACGVVGTDEAGVPVLNTDTRELTMEGDFAGRDFFNTWNATQLSLGKFIGYIDEFRLWTKALTEAEIMENYDHLLVGNEKNLETYWTFDEGLNTQFFDYSRDGTVYHEHHGKIVSNAEPSTLTADKLKLKARTDRDGNYIIKGIPFSGEGTTYAVIPSMGIHQFNPTQQMRYVGNNSLVHNGTDFTDISSFPVRGTIRYAGTDYPVEGVNFYVDGQICAKEGSPITTNAYGEYEISVPIGEHYITVAKHGHEFADGGRYPADPNKTGTLVNYNDAVSGLDFEDVTLVTVAGRVTGGKIEEEKPLGFGESKNNIGQATIVLGIDNYRLNVVRNEQGTTVSYDNNPADVAVSSPTTDVQSMTCRKGGDADEVKQIIIKTDPATGEFAALLPPIDYRVESITIESNPSIIFDNLPVIYANDPMNTETDSLELEDGTKKEFEYVAKMIQSYYTEPVLEVTQKDRTDGSFGEQTHIYTDSKTQEETELTLFTSEGGTVTYNYGFPIFEQMKQYTFDVRGYETYVNNDDPENIVVDEVPLQNVPVTFTNQMGTGQGVVIDATKTADVDEDGDLAGEAIPDEVTLDAEGRGQYRWQAGFPNITSPYTRTLAATYVHNDKGYTWTGVNTTNSLSGIVIGALPTGSNFVTGGPDEVDMIIRDPGGSGSSAFWEKGTSVTDTRTQTITVNNTTEMMTHTEFGFELTSLMAAGVAVIMGVIETNKSKVDLDVGVTTEYEHVSADTKVLTTTSTKRISTSSEPEYVGAQGDVFIGQSTNIVFGSARSVGFKKNGSGDIELLKFDNYVTSQEFATHFQYTQNFIENTLIPNLIVLRNDILNDGFDDHGLIYHTDLTEDDDNYGAPGTYTVERPNGTLFLFYTDMVQYYNQSIATWKKHLAHNEEMKVKAINDRRKWLDSNQSFDSGTFIDSEVSTEKTKGETTSNTFNTSLIFGSGTSVSIFGQDVDISVQNTTTAGSEWEHSVDSVFTTTTGYSLAEVGDDDALSIDVFKAPDGKGAIFVTRGGQTTCPYEGEQRTKYFEPGKHIIATATQQIEMPKIAVENGANRLVGVPAGKMANYTLLLTNESETEEDCYFDLFVIDETNTNGAGLDINSNELGSGRSVLVPAGGTVRMNLELEQNAHGDLSYEDIAIVLSSQCQRDPASTWDVIGDTVYISATFVPTSTDVALRIDNRVVNTSTKGMLPLSVSGYDPTYDGLEYIAVQYQGVGETAWHDARKYVMTEGDIVNPIDEVLPTSGIINLNFDMTNSTVFPDRTYKFRALSARTYDNDVVTNVSDEITVVKDMSRPKPLGQPQPTDGILSAGDELSVLFNETILNGELTKDKNFRVTGILNGSEIAHLTALGLQNTAQTATTEADINLAGKDFSIDTWMNINGAGTLLSHGTGTHKLTVGVDDNSKLAVKIGDQTYTSQEDVPQNKWAFLTLSMTADGKLSASVATDATTLTMFNELPVVAYEGNGPLAVGQEMTGAMHELLLWDEARDVATALQQRSVTKNPSTQGLIGYWKMDEGEGTKLTDYARNRHMTMTAETWHLENENKAVTLDGSHYVGITTTDIPPMPQDDYAVELWVKAPTQTGEAQLLQMGEASLVIKSDGSLSLENNDSPYGLGNLKELTSANVQLTDNAWHHVALSVLRNGNANIYVDGVAKATISADRIGSLGSDLLLVGARRILQDKVNSDVLYLYDRPLTGVVDEVRVWNATMNANLLKKQRKVRLTGSEPGLVAYYPFEVKTLDSHNQVITNGSAADLCSEYHAQLYTLSVPTPNTSYPIAEADYTDNAPALRLKPEEENVSFTFTASDNKIVIELNEEPAKVEGCTLNFTVRDVHDQNGNLSEPVTWSAFVNQNPLMWQETQLALTQKVTEESTMTATLVNKSGKEQAWTMSALPAWLKADMELGNLLPLAEQVITFTVSEATPIGKYEQTVYVSGNEGIETPLTLNITVTGNLPDWAVNPYDYESSMNVIGVLKKDGTPLTDPDDIVAAFIGDECRGLAHLEYNEVYGNYYVTMDIYGNSSEARQEVTFRAYDASTGTIYPVVTWTEATSFKYIPVTLLGSYAEPKVFNIQDKIEQVAELKAGWNWISFYVEAEDMRVSELFKDVADDVLTVKGQNGYLSKEGDTWDGDLTGDLSNTALYAVQMKADRKLRVVGTSVNEPVTVQTGWNWIGYFGSQVASLGDALAGMTKANGDIVKAQRGVAYWDGNNSQWLGSLLMMEPGRGYQLKSTANDQTFYYPGTFAGSGPKHSPIFRAKQMGQTFKAFTPVNFRNYPDNAIMAVKVVTNGMSMSDIEVGVFADEECRTAAVTNANGIAYLTIPGEEECELSFRVAIDDEVLTAPLTLTYESDAIYGTPKNPIVLDLTDVATGIGGMGDGQDSEVYDISGRKMDSRKLQRGVYIINGQKKTVK